VHNNIRLPNFLLNGNNYLKVVDFDNTIKTKSEFDNCQLLYARVLNNKNANKRETFEYYSSCIEQFAIDSIFYYIIRDFEFYDNK